MCTDKISKTALLLSLLGWFFNIQAQSYDSSFRFYYYDQKLSMFAEMSDQEDEIVWLGDSITDGGEWSELFPQYTTLNRGISSDNTFGVLNRIDEVIHRHPQKLFILIGINDIARDIPNDIILRNYSLIVSRVKSGSPGTKLYLQTLLPTNNQFAAFPKHKNKEQAIATVNEGIRNIASKQGASVIDLYHSFKDADGRLNKAYTNDGLHLIGAGYKHWKEVLEQAKAL